MAILPVIVGMGGINCAGRTSGFHSYKRIIADVLFSSDMENTWLDLAHRMGLRSAFSPAPLSHAEIETLKRGTLLRKIESFDTDNSRFKSGVTSGGNIPKGFDPGKLYNSHHHPRGLKLTIYGVSDALNSLGMGWNEILSHIKPDEVSVYAGSALGQIDEYSLSGLISEPLLERRVTSKMLALSLAEMPADFINSYVINSVGTTGTNMGACATFLYNLRQGMIDIQTGKAKVVIVGNAEAPIVPELIEGFRSMGALATDEALSALDNIDNVLKVNHRRACRPFSTNVGFTMAEASQFVILMNDALALKLGANIYGSIADIFINADANKKSISKPGIGNYITFAKTTALAKALLGESSLSNTYVQAHGTGTPQNRTTESHILNETAKTFGIKSWPVAAIKAYLGHPMSAAAGDQLITALGVWKYGFIPGIKTIDHIAEDVHHSHLNILREHLNVGDKGEHMKAVLINSKGFGGNNATALVLSPEQTCQMLKFKHGKKQFQSYQKKNETVANIRDEIDLKTCMGDEKITYNFGQNVMDESSVELMQTHIKLTEFASAIDLPVTHPYPEYCASKEHESVVF